MTTFTETGSGHLAHLAIAMARELPYLRPSQQRQISRLLETPEQVAVFSKAIELALQSIAGDSDEVAERVYLLGLEVRQMFDARQAQHLHLHGQWDNIAAPVIEAFAGGFIRAPFEDTLDAVRAARVRQSKRGQVGSRRAYGIDDVEVLAVAQSELSGPVAP